MRAILGLAAALAVGLLLATGIALVGADRLPLGNGGQGAARLDYGSLGLGLILGMLITSIASVGWSELPRRAVAWLVSKRRTFRLLGWGTVFVAVLMLY